MFILLSFNSEDEKEKFYYIYEKYKRLLLYKANEILKDNYLAEDSTSEAFLRIYKNLHKIEDVDSNSTIAFLVTIVKNTSLTLLKKQKQNPVYELFENDEVDDFDVEEHIFSKINIEEVYNLLDKLPDDQKSIFVLKYTKDLSHKDIGELLGITENNVTVKFHRARKNIEKIIKEMEGTNHEQR